MSESAYSAPPESEFREALTGAILLNCPFEGQTVDPAIALDEFRNDPTRQGSMGSWAGRFADKEMPAVKAALFFILNEGHWWVPAQADSSGDK